MCFEYENKLSLYFRRFSILYAFSFHSTAFFPLLFNKFSVFSSRSPPPHVVFFELISSSLTRASKKTNKNFNLPFVFLPRMVAFAKAYPTFRRVYVRRNETLTLFEISDLFDEIRNVGFFYLGES